MANGGRGDAKATAADAAEAVAGKRQDEPFGRAAAPFGYGPPADFRVTQPLAARPFQFGLDAFPSLLRHSIERASGVWRTRKSSTSTELGMLEIPRASRDAAPRVDHQQVPALMVFGRIVQAVGGQLVPSHRAIFEINLAAQLLHVADKPPMQHWIVFDVLEKSGNAGRGASKIKR